MRVYPYSCIANLNFEMDKIKMNRPINMSLHRFISAQYTNVPKVYINVPIPKVYTNGYIYRSIKGLLLEHDTKPQFWQCRSIDVSQGDGHNVYEISFFFEDFFLAGGLYRELHVCLIRFSAPTAGKTLCGFCKSSLLFFTAYFIPNTAVPGRWCLLLYRWQIRNQQIFLPRSLWSEEIADLVLSQRCACLNYIFR